jgi:hypothetical protein
LSRKTSSSIASSTNLTFPPVLDKTKLVRWVLLGLKYKWQHPKIYCSVNRHSLLYNESQSHEKLNKSFAITVCLNISNLITTNFCDEKFWEMFLLKSTWGIEEDWEHLGKVTGSWYSSFFSFKITTQKLFSRDKIGRFWRYRLLQIFDVSLIWITTSWFLTNKYFPENLFARLIL